MKRKLILAAIPLIFLGMAAINISRGFLCPVKEVKPETRESGKGPSEPADWFYLMRSTPGEPFDYAAYRSAMLQCINGIRNRSGFPGSNGDWVLEGPLNINGRVNCIEVHPQNSQVFFIGSASGGIYKTSDGGNSWVPVFRDFPYLAVGDIAINPQDPQIIYAGTGDPNISGYPFIGAGIFKSSDGGNNWTYSGLANTFITSRICINPKHPDTLYAATMGLPFVRDNNRGLYKSTDGGMSWTQVLFLSNQAGIIDLVMDPQHPDTLYAAGWDRIRNNQESTVSGSAAKIYKTLDGGQTWTMLTSGLPLTDMSRIGLWMSSLNSQVLFASYVDPMMNLQGIYKTTNGGQNWSSIGTAALPPDVMGGFGWYFGQIRTNPSDDNDIFLLGVDLWRTQDGGLTWNMAAPSWDQYIVHADKHDLQFVSSTGFLLATDGGVYKTQNNAVSWQDADATPTTQFYRVNYNPHEPGTYYGGAQDNGTLGGGSVTPAAWMRYLGGDGFQPLFDPLLPDLRYYETQNGSLYYDDGFSIEDFTYGIDFNDRRSWDMPVIMSTHDHERLYTGTYRVYRIPDAPYGSWSAISGDLTDGVIYGDRYHVITTVAESPANPSLLYAGTSDANVWRTTNGGSSWTNITSGLPNQYVTHLLASPDDVQTLYVAHSGYKSNDFIPHLHRSDNQGSAWTDISANLPPLGVNNIEVMPGTQGDIIFAATDGGVYVSIDAGNAWQRLGANMPPVAVYDIVYDTLTSKLIAGTYGCGIYSYSLDSLFDYYSSTTNVKNNQLTDNALHIFPNPAGDYICYFFDKNLTSPKKLTIFGLNGSHIHTESLGGNNQKTMDVSFLPKGIYILVVYDNNNRIKGKEKFVKL